MSNHTNPLIREIRGLEPASFSEHRQHPHRDHQHYSNGAKETIVVMQPGNGFEVHSKYSADNGSRSQQAGNNGHYLHHFIHPQIYIVDVQVLHAHHNITVVFAKIISLYNMIINVFKIFGGAVIEQITFTSLNTA